MNSSNNQSALDLGTDPTANTENQVESKSYTQQEVDAMMARMRGSLEKKLLKPYAELGDPEELRSMKAEAEQRRTAEQMKRGEFEKTLQELASKKDAEIQKRDSVIKEYKVNTPLVSAAAKYRAVNADQVKALLASNVRLNNDGEVEVVDTRGTVRYNDHGEPLGVEDLVREFLDSNPHFVSATPTTTNARSNVDQSNTGPIDISKLDLKLAAHRQIYAKEMARRK
jgi:hypothetical protein